MRVLLLLLAACTCDQPVPPQPDAPEPDEEPWPYVLTGVTCDPTATADDDATAETLALVALQCVSSGDLQTGRVSAEAARLKDESSALTAYSLARVMLAQRRSDSEPCGSEAYLDTIVDLLSASAVDPSFRARMLVDDLTVEVRTSARYRLATGLGTDAASLQAGLVGVVFHTPGAGAYGSTGQLHLHPGGAAVVKTLEIPSDADPFWTERRTGWQAFDGGIAIGEGDARVRYTLNERGELSDGDGDMQDYVAHPSECEA